MNVRKIVVAFLAASMAITANAQVWKPTSPVLLTRWAKDVSQVNPLPEYPRPQMVRKEWQNLNGLWYYAIREINSVVPSGYDGTILVPYPLESALSGVKASLQPSENLWYKRSFDKPVMRKGERVLLHFGAVDWQATVWVNGREVGAHEGGYTDFSFDITDVLKPGENTLMVKVFDPTDHGVGPHGKQVLNPGGIYYTATSGIWQTVWLETVPAAHIVELKLTPDIDKGVLNASVRIEGRDGKTFGGYSVELSAGDGEKEVGKVKGAPGTDLAIPVPNARLWSPGHPFLYDLRIKLLKGDKVVDEVGSYFGMRKIAIAKDEQGVDRIFLNNRPYYNLGVLDQGFWPDGLYTAPTDEALAFDIKVIKAMGFNTIRKHIKVEPARWYYHADELGVLVWQDMVNPNPGLPKGAKAAFEQQCSETLEQLHDYPCITTWVLFNEKWGQYDQARLTKWLKEMDPSRIVDGHTGELLYVDDQLQSPSPNAYVGADMTDVHSYPYPMMPVRQTGKARVLGEFGGIGVFIPDHQWNAVKGWGYIQETPSALESKYKVMCEHLALLERQGLSGSIYTQPYDVEGEQNGLMTYDREVVKIPLDTLRAIHAGLNPDMGILPAMSVKDADLTDPEVIYSRLLQQYINGDREPVFLKSLVIKAMEVGDKAGAEIVGSDYVTTLSASLSEEEIRLVVQLTRSTGDPGFVLMKNNEALFRKVLGDRPYTLSMMNLIFKGEIEPILAETDEPDWDAIKARVKPYGEPGEEIYLRARTVALYNQHNWKEYGPVATEYLEKYGKNLKKSEMTKFQEAINKN